MASRTSSTSSTSRAGDAARFSLDVAPVRRPAPMTRDQARKLAKAKWGPAAAVQVSPRLGNLHGVLYRGSGSVRVTLGTGATWEEAFAAACASEERTGSGWQR